MLYLAFIYHMHQPYYQNLLTREMDMPWVRLHGTKDYLDMLQILEKYPNIRQTFNLVPSLIEQIEAYANNTAKDKFFELSLKPAKELNAQDKAFILDNFFSINKDRVISVHPRYYDLFLKKQSQAKWDTQDYLDLQVWFNLAWIDPSFRENFPELKRLVHKGRIFTEEEKALALNKQIEIIKDIMPAYKKFAQSSQIEITTTPFYHPILPLLYDTTIAKQANPRAILPKIRFAWPEDAKSQIDKAVEFHASRFGAPPTGMWPSEESVSEHILPFIIRAGIQWIVTDEAILFKSLKMRKRNTKLLYQPHRLKRKEGELTIIFRDRNLSDIISFVYQAWKPEVAVADFMKHLEEIHASFKDEDILVTVAMDGENAWEFFVNDGHDFLNALYQKLSLCPFVKTTTVKDYLQTHPVKSEIEYLKPGSWIFGEFGKWIGNPYKVKGWEHLAIARKSLEESLGSMDKKNLDLAWKQMYILEGSDWFWWFGEDHADFDKLFKAHLSNLYTLINKTMPDSLK
ncbi:MAG: glycoside hydrolase family 57 protein [Candidatus Omnitrophota bacterium]